MAPRVAPEAEAQLDNIWYYVAKESCSIEVADRLIDSITERFYLLACHPHIGPSDDTAMRICVPAYAVFPWASMSSSIASKRRPMLLVFAALGYVFHGVEKRLRSFRTMNSPIHHIVPCDVGIEVMSFGLLFEQSL
jgi:hypothetical protein